MSHPFNPKHGPILVEAEVTGPDRSMTLPLILDTGATTSLLNEAVLLALGYDLASVTDRVPMTTGSLGHVRPEGDPDKVDGLGSASVRLPRAGLHTARERVGSGLLGLDFLRDQVLTIDFRAGQITLT